MQLTECRYAICFAALILAGRGGAFAQPPAVLNLSHDLVANRIAAQDMAANSHSLDARPLFEAGIGYGSKNHIPNVTADRGSYYFLTQNGAFRHALLNAITNVAVDLQYSDLYFAQGNIIGIQTVGCVNLTLKNFTADYLQLPFTQLTVPGVNAATKPTSLKQRGTYPLSSTFNSVTVPTNYVVSGYFVFVFRNGQELRTTGRMEATPPFNDSSIQITSTQPWSQSSNIASIQPGDTLVFTFRAGVATIQAHSSPGFALQNASVYASGLLGVSSAYGSAITIDRVQVIPRPGTDRLIATNADGIHLSKAGANNVVSNNTVRRGCDDAIPIAGQWDAILNAANDGPTVQVKRNSDAPLPMNVPFEFINYNNASVVGTASIIPENPIPSQQTGLPGELITLTLDHTIPGLQSHFGFTHSVPQLRGAGTVISGHLVHEEAVMRAIYLAGVATST